MAWVESQNAPEVFDNAGFNAQIGDVFLQQMMSACGGKDSPIGAAMFDELEGLVDGAAREEQETSFFVEALSHGARDFTWYLRDNLQSVLTERVGPAARPGLRGVDRLHSGAARVRAAEGGVVAVGHEQ